MRRNILSRVQFQKNLTSSRSFLSSFVSFDPFNSSKEYEMIIENLANNGMGVGRISYQTSTLTKQWVVMVPYTVPGEKIKFKISKTYKSYSEGKLLKVIEPLSKVTSSPSSPLFTPLTERSSSIPCPHFTSCHGCSYQHLSIESQRSWKHFQIISELSKLGKYDSSVLSLVSPPLGTDKIYHYRKKLTPNFTLEAKTSNESNAETSKKDNSNLTIGFYQQDPYKLFDISYCFLASERINEKYKEEREKLQKIIQMNSKNQLDKEKLKKLSINPSSSLLFREDYEGNVHINKSSELIEKIFGVQFLFKAADFFQVNPEVAEMIVRFVIESIIGKINHNNEEVNQKENDETLVDIYCGSGLFSLTSSPYFNKIISIEISHPAIENLKKNCILNNLTNISPYNISDKKLFQNKRILQLFNTLDKNKTSVIINPPRSGCDKDFLFQLKKFQFKRIIYISCNPTTQIRDSRILTHNEYNDYNKEKNNIQDSLRNYYIKKIQPFDMFPQTKHIENVMVFEIENI